MLVLSIKETNLLEIGTEHERRKSLWNVGIFIDFSVEDIQVGREIRGVEAEGSVVQLDSTLGDPLSSHLKAELGSRY